jgi:ubiquinone biosynthesis protein UbiJ
MSELTARLIVPALNHVLSSEPWAVARLQPYAGKSLQIVAYPIELRLCISVNGLFSAADGQSEPPAVTITLPDDTTFKVLSGNQAAAFAAARLSGSAEFAETVAFVFRNLRWDVEADVAAVIGDIPAHRSFAAIQNFIALQKRSVTNLGRNFKEFLTEDSQQLVAQRDISAFSQSVETLRDDLARLEKRISKL